MNQASFDAHLANAKTVRARELLREGGYTCVCCSDTETLTERARGVAPLMRLIDESKSLRGFCTADKVVGRAAAFLYVLLKVEELYAEVISEAAAEVLCRYRIPFFAESTVPAIRNRTGDGFCPMETATREVETPEMALEVLRQTLKRLKASQS